MEIANRCFVDYLDVLKISSKEAVENIDQFSDFKEYMHVKRAVQDELINVIERASKSHKSELILICGSVGDGKSHLLSYMKHHYGDMLASFYLHNDASESLNPNKTSMDTLSEVLEAFSDEGLAQEKKAKVIVAINLGTLNNFIESKYKEKFSLFREFVYKHKIIEPDITFYEYDVNSPFHYVNFTDYHMYKLTEKGPKSEYIEDLLLKVVSQDENSYFYEKYKKTCSDCTLRKTCPVSANYELIKVPSVRKGIANILVKAMIKEKLIISTRDLLNLFNDFITAGYSSEQLIKLNQAKPTIEQLLIQMEALLFNNLFDVEQRSHVLDQLAKIDPVHEMTLEDEEKRIQYELSNHILNTLKCDMDDLSWDYISYLVNQFSRIIQEGDGISSIKLNRLKELSFKTYKRFQSFNGTEEKDTIYSQYMMDLYYTNKRMKRGLKDIVKEVKEALYKWDGSNESQGVRIISSKRHKHLGIYERISIKPQLKEFVELEQEELDRFITTIVLKFTRENREEEAVLDLDYPLYKLIKMLSRGYVPTEEEYYENINLQLFIEKLLNQGEEEKELIFEDTTSGELKRYSLVYNSDFEEYEFVGI